MHVVRSGLSEDGTPRSVMLGCAIGDIIPHFGTTAPPGTLICDGSEVSREVYHELYEEIGALVGQGDGSTTFNLPDLRGRWMMGVDAEHEVGEEIGEGLPNITGLTRCPTRVGSGAFTANESEVYHFGTGNEGIFSLEFDASHSSAIYGASDHVTPASVAVLPCIVYE